MIQITLNTLMGMEQLFGGKKSQIIQLPQNSTIESMLHDLRRMFEESFKDYVTMQDFIFQKRIVIMVNGVSIYAKDNFATKIHDGDRVLFFPPIAGG